MTGGEHITLDDMFKSAEIVRRNAEAVEVEKDKKRRLEYRTRRAAARPVLNRLENVLENAVTWLTGKEELEVLIRWKGVPVLKMGNVAMTLAISTIRRWRRGGRGRCEHPRPMDGCQRGGARGAEERAH